MLIAFALEIRRTVEIVPLKKGKLWALGMTCFYEAIIFKSPEKCFMVTVGTGCSWESIGTRFPKNRFRRNNRNS